MLAGETRVAMEVVAMEDMMVEGPKEKWMVVGSREDRTADEIPERPRRRPLWRRATAAMMEGGAKGVL